MSYVSEIYNFYSIFHDNDDSFLDLQVAFNAQNSIITKL